MNKTLQNLIIRALSGAVFVVLMLGAIWLSSFYFAIVFLAFTFLGLKEFYSLSSHHNVVKVNGWLAIAGGVLLFLIATGVSFLQWSPKWFALYLIYIPILFIPELYRSVGTPIQNIAVSLMGHIYVAIPFTIFCLIEPISKELVLAFFVLIWASDTGAYLVGVCIGKHKMFERISPKKTWEGFLGGLAFALGFGYLFYRLNWVELPQADLMFWMILSALIFVVGVFGDLVESMFKRSVGVKDSGNIMPGHGGMLDRFDSACLAAPVLAAVYLLLV
ncbi:MAG: phosphatidate cytidylyltransferase [Bacteroidales bacterium]|nr:phosphatidate cytidylyltransferase [Bacteroidales bacterium]